MIVAAMTRRRRTARRRSAPAAPARRRHGPRSMPPSARSVKATPWLRSGPLGLASCSAIASSIHRSWVIGVECWDAPWETWSVMSTSPALVSIGEPLIEFNRPREGDGRTWLQGFGGDSQNVAIAAVRQGSSAGYITSLGQDWMGDAFLELWQSEGLDASRVSRHPTAPTGVSFVTHGPAGHKFDYLRKNSAASLMTPETLAGRLHRRRPLLPPVGHRPGDQRQRAQDLRRRRFGRTRRRGEGLLRHQPPPAAVGPRRRRGRPSTPRWRAATSCCRASTIPNSSPASRSRTPSSITISSSARPWSR